MRHEEGLYVDRHLQWLSEIEFMVFGVFKIGDVK